MTDNEPQQIQQRLDHALSDVFHAADGSVVNRWILLADVMDPDGERAMVNMCQPNMKAWDNLGMLEYTRQIEQAATVAELAE